MDNQDIPIRFDAVSYFYADVDEESSDAAAGVTQVFSHLSLELPTGMLSVLGENGIGKSTFMLLAGARFQPTAGDVYLFGRNTKDFEGAPESPELEEARNRIASFVYQNMEFETDEPIGDLLEYVYENGFHESKDTGFLSELHEVLELSGELHKKTQNLSKGALQRTIIAFSMLYGSRSIFMDEPVFALEEPQKDRVFDYLRNFSRRTGTPIYYSAHNLDLTEKYSDYMLLFRKQDEPLVGPTSELFTRDNLEQAYRVPLQTLYRREYLYREMLNHRATAFREQDGES